MDAVADNPHSPVSHRHSKFTAEAIRQINDLVEQGKNRDEIAEILGVTPGTLAVTCSKLKISLRRPPAARRRGAVSPRVHQRRQGEPNKQRSLYGSSASKSETAPRRATLRAKDDMRSATLAVQMTFKGASRTVELPLTGDMIGELALEAELRDAKLPELVAQLLISIIQRGLFQFVLDENAESKIARAPE